MRRVRSQFDNLSAVSRGNGGIAAPVGFNRMTDTVQRSIDEVTGSGWESHSGYANATPPYGAPAPSLGQFSHPAANANAMHPYQHAASAAYPVDPREMDNIRASLDRLNAKMQTIASSAGGATRGSAQESGLLASQLQKIEQDLSGLGNRMESDMSGVRDVLTGLKDALGTVASQGLGHQDMAGLRDDLLEQVRAANNELSSHLSDPATFAQAVEISHQELSSRLQEIAGSLEVLAARPFDAQVDLSSIETRLHEIGMATAELGTSIGQGGADLSPIEARLEGLQATIDTIASGQGTNTQLDERFDELSRALTALSSSGNATDSVERIEARVSELSKTVDGFVATATTGQTTSPEVESQAMQELLQGISAIQQQIAGQGDGSGAAFDGLASQINRLSEKLDNLAAVSPGAGETGGGDNSALIGRLDELVARVESVGNATQGAGGLVTVEAQLNHLAAEMESLRGQLSSADPAGGTPGNASAILEHLEAISARIDGLGTGASGEGGANLASLEEQVAWIAQNLGNTGNGSLEPIEQRLVGIEEQIGASRDIAIEVASQAAEDAVKRTIAEMPAPQIGEAPVMDTTAINALADDLRNLHDHTVSANTSSLETFDAVKDTLGLIVSRLNDIETGIRDAREQVSSQPAPVPAAMATADPAMATADQAMVSMPEPESVLHGAGMDTWQDALSEPDPAATPAESMASFEPVVSGDGSGLPEMDSPRMDADDLPSIMPEPVSETEPASAGDDAPLEPGSGAPDLAALVRQAGRRRANGGTSEDVSGAEFLAAARRAAQATAQQAEQVQEELVEEEKQGSSLLAKLPGVFARRRKVMLIAGAAILLVAIAVPLASRFLNTGIPAIDNNTPAVTQQMSTEPAAPAGDGAVRIAEPSSEANSESPTPAAPQQSGQSELQNDVAEAPVAEAPDSGAPETAAAPAAATPSAEPHEVSFGTDAFREAVSNRDPVALFEVGRRYTDGIGVTKDLAAAADWYRRSAELGFAPAQYRLGNFYEKGHGLPADAVEAARWYRLAADNGNVVAMHNLAVLHSGKKLAEKPDIDKAFSWFKKAASYGVRDSQVNVGILYTNGAPSEGQNLVEAYKWFAVAAKGGDSDAGSKRDIVANAMRPDQLEQARAEAELWKAATPKPDANEINIPAGWKGAKPATASLGSKKDMIQTAQTLLSKLGFDPGPADGLMGRKTREAIKAFQQRVGMAVDGKVGPELIEALNAVSI